MPHFACHRLIAPFQGEKRMQRVELDECGFFRTSVPLCAETPHTVWVAGVCVLLPQGTTPVCGDTLQELLARVEPVAAFGRLCLWHVAGMPADIPLSAPVSCWERIC